MPEAVGFDKAATKHLKSQNGTSVCKNRNYRSFRVAPWWLGWYLRALLEGLTAFYGKWYDGCR